MAINPEVNELLNAVSRIQAEVDDLQKKIDGLTPWLKGALTKLSQTNFETQTGFKVDDVVRLVSQHQLGSIPSGAQVLIKAIEIPFGWTENRRAYYPQDTKYKHSEEFWKRWAVTGVILTEQGTPHRGRRPVKIESISQQRFFKV